MFLRATTFLSGIGGAKSAVPRWGLEANTGIQVYGKGGMFWSKKQIIVRNAPYTINNPHKGQIEARINFGDTASGTKGQRGFSAEGLPKPASIIKSQVAGYRAPDRLAVEQYPSSLRHTLHTLAELKVMLAEMEGRGAAAEFR